MAKRKSRHAMRMDQLRNTGNVDLSTKEGRWEIRFVFDGKEYKKAHQLSVTEVKHMKDLCVEFGDQAADQIIWRAAIKGIGMVSESLLAEAGKEFVGLHHKGQYSGPAANESTSIASYETLAALEGFVESRKPLPDDKAFDPEEAAKIAQEEIGDKL